MYSPHRRGAQYITVHSWFK